MTMTTIDLLVERHIKGSKRMILFSKSFDDAYNESLEIILQEFGYQPQDIHIKVDKYNELVEFHDYDWTLLAKMRKEPNKYTLVTIIG